MRRLKIKWFVFLEVFFLILSRAVVAQGFFGEFDPIKFIFGPEVPSEWYQPYMFMQWLVFPFIGVWLVLFGIMEQLSIFRARRSIGGVLALIMALIMSSTGGIVVVARTLFQTMGTWGLLVFAGVFLFGVTIWGWAEGRRFWGQRNVLKDLEGEIGHVKQEIGDVENAILSPRANLNQHQIDSLNKRRDQLYQRLKEMEYKKQEYLHG